ncbi:MAG: diguanylate cyclase domain-containing protein [Leptospirillia bacterium]
MLPTRLSPQTLQALSKDLLSVLPCDILLFEEVMTPKGVLKGGFIEEASKRPTSPPCQGFVRTLRKTFSTSVRPLPDLRLFRPRIISHVGDHPLDPSLVGERVKLSGLSLPVVSGQKIRGLFTLLSCPEYAAPTRTHLLQGQRLLNSLTSSPIVSVADDESRLCAEIDRLVRVTDLTRQTPESLSLQILRALKHLLAPAMVGVYLFGPESSAPLVAHLTGVRSRTLKRSLGEELQKHPAPQRIQSSRRIAELAELSRASLLRRPIFSGYDVALVVGHRGSSLGSFRSVLPVMDRLLDRIHPSLAAILTLRDRDCLAVRYQQVSLLYQAQTAVHRMLEDASDESRLFEELCELLVTQGGIVNAAVYTLDPAGKSLEIRSVSDRNMPATLLPMVRQFSLDPSHKDRETLTIRTFRSRRKGIQNNIVAWYRKKGMFDRANYYEQHHWISVGVFPLFRGGDPYGILGVATHQKNFYDNHTADLLEHTAAAVSRNLDALVAQQERKVVEERLSSLVATIPQGVVFLDQEGRWLLANARAREFFSLGDPVRWQGRTGREIQKSCPDIFGLMAPLLDMEGEAWKKAQPLSRMISLVSPGQRERFLAVEMIPLFSEDGSRRALILSATDMTEQKKAEAIIAHMAFHDSLTDLPNRRLLTDTATERLLSRPVGREIGLGILDLDGFKEVNDRLGHQAGDHLLQAVVRRLSEIVTPPHLLARLGGDEFGLLLDCDTLSEAERLIQNMIEALHRPFVVDGHHLTISASVGAAFSYDGETDIKTLLRQADLSLYAVKKNGKNGWQVFSGEDPFRPLS